MEGLCVHAMMAPVYRGMSSFQPVRRFHIALAVTDIEASLPFYRVLLQSEPVKVRPDYVKFEIDEPGLNLTLNQVQRADHPSRPPEHFGLQVSTTDQVASAQARFETAGFTVEVEEQVTCCYAVQDKFWAIDRDGHRWEVFVTHADAEVRHGPVTQASPCCEPQTESADEPCCAPRCCND